MGFFDSQNHPKRYQLGPMIGSLIVLGVCGDIFGEKMELDDKNCFKTSFFGAKFTKFASINPYYFKLTPK